MAPKENADKLRDLESQLRECGGEPAELLPILKGLGENWCASRRVNGDYENMIQEAIMVTIFAQKQGRIRSSIPQYFYGTLRNLLRKLLVDRLNLKSSFAEEKPQSISPVGLLYQQLEENRALILEHMTANYGTKGSVTQFVALLEVLNIDSHRGYARDEVLAQIAACSVGRVRLERAIFEKAMTPPQPHIPSHLPSDPDLVIQHVERLFPPDSANSMKPAKPAIIGLLDIACDEPAEEWRESIVAYALGSSVQYVHRLRTWTSEKLKKDEDLHWKLGMSRE